MSSPRPRSHSIRQPVSPSSPSRSSDKDRRASPTPRSAALRNSEDKIRPSWPGSFSLSSAMSWLSYDTLRRLVTDRFHRRRLILAIAVALVLTTLFSQQPVGLLPSTEAPCEFVSTTEAYARDLALICELHGLDCGNANGNDNATAAAGKSPRAAHHTFSSTGHLVLSDDKSARHPIPQLIALGEKRWEDLLSRQSRTLSEAVTEYESRYGRRPPRGFDRWWAFAVEHDIILPDEYDRINQDLAPFWALPRAELQKRLAFVEAMPEVFVVDIHKSKASYNIYDRGGLKWGGTRSRARQMTALLSSVVKYMPDMPDMRATFSIFDQPQIYLSWARRNSLTKLGRKGEHTSYVDEWDDYSVRLSRSCPPDSPLRTNASAHEGRSFVFDSLEAADVCQNPYIVPLHGLTIEPHTAETHPRLHTRLLPIFSLAKTSLNSDIVVTPLEQFDFNPEPDLAWERKHDPRLLWRGSPTGISMMTNETDWRSSHRWRLHEFSNNNGTEPVEFIVPELGVSEPGVATETLPARTAAEYFFDMALTGKPMQCSKEDGTCDAMAREIKWAPRQHPIERRKYKYVLDIDGNGWSGRFRRLMASNSVVIKTGIFTEWFQPHLIPWFMYIPSKLNFSDLTDIMAFFTGSPGQPDAGFDQTAKALAQNGKCFVERMFRYDDLQAYMLRLMLEYARIVAPEGEDMDYHHVGGDEDAVDWEDDH